MPHSSHHAHKGLRTSCRSSAPPLCQDRLPWWGQPGGLLHRAVLCATAILLLVAAGTAAARPVPCENNLVRDWDFGSTAAWTIELGSVDHSDAGDYVGMWGNREVGEALGQVLPQGLVAGRTYLISLRARNGKDPNKVNYSQVRLVGWPAGAAPNVYEDLFSAPRVQIGQPWLIASTDWVPVSFGPWPATSDLAGIALHVINEHEVDDGNLTSYANLDDLCIRELVPPTLCGTKYQDAGCDGEKGAGEVGLPGWKIVLTTPDGEVRTTTTDGDGEYCFDDLVAGSYQVAEESRPGWVQTAPKPFGHHTVQLAREGDVDGIDFGNQLCGRCPSDGCADPRDPRFEYVMEDPAACAWIRYVCEPGEEYFSDDCGCGCRKPCQRTAIATGLHYVGETCSSAIRRAETSFDSGHYRNACAEAFGEAPEGPVGVRAVTHCRSQDEGVYLDVEVCCPEPAGEPDLAVRKELVGPTDDESVHLVFRITVENVGNASMAGPVEVRDVLPEGYVFVSGGGCTTSGQQVTCTHDGDLAAGETATFELVTQLDRSAFRDRTNCATVLSDSGGGDPTDDTACLPLLCPDRSDPTVHYLVERSSREDHALCPRLLGRCGDGQKPFWGACGCGCIDEPRCIKWPDRVGDPTTLLSAEEPATDLEGLLALPRELEPGERVAVTPLAPERTPAEGTWRINGQVVEPRDPLPMALCPRPWWSFDVPVDWRQGLDLVVTYTHPEGDVLVDARPEVEVVEPPVEDTPESPWIEGGTAFTTPGSQACVCGSFPTLESRSALLLDGGALGSPTAASRRSVSFRLPTDLPLGDHDVTGWIGAGFVDGTNRWPLGVIDVRASLDASVLAQGGSTRLLLQVVGTERPVALGLRNFSPSVVVVEGGDDQTLTTSGGAENVAMVEVRGVGRGDFDLRWELPGCPCGD